MSRTPTIEELHQQHEALKRSHEQLRQDHETLRREVHDELGAIRLAQSEFGQSLGTAVANISRVANDVTKLDYAVRSIAKGVDRLQVLIPEIK